MDAQICISKVTDVQDTATTLGCRIPTDIALLPRNFFSANSKDELVHERDAITLRIYLRQAQISETSLEGDGESFPEILEHGIVDVVAPVMFITFSAMSQNPHLLSIAIGVLSNYLTDFFKGRLGEKTARVNIVVKTKSGDYRKVSYEGPVNGLNALSEVVSSVAQEQCTGEMKSRGSDEV